MVHNLKTHKIEFLIPKDTRISPNGETIVIAEIRGPERLDACLVESITEENQEVLIAKYLIIIITIKKGQIIGICRPVIGIVKVGAKVLSGNNEIEFLKKLMR